MRALPDVIVCGAGVVGAAVARALCADGLTVEIIDTPSPAAAATAGGMGHMVVMDDTAAQFALTRWSLSILRDIEWSLPHGCELDRTGTLWLAEDDVQLDALRERAARYTSAGITVAMLDERQLADAEPNLRRGLTGAMHVADDAVLYPPAFAAALLRDALASRASFTYGSVVALEQGGVRLATGERRQAGAVVNACGVHAPTLTPRLKVVPRRGHLIITDRYPGFCRHQLVESGYMASTHTAGAAAAASVAFNVQPRRTGQVLIGSSREYAGCDTRPDAAVAARMLERACSFMPALGALSVLRTWAALRPATPDKLPYIGRSPDQPGVWIATGHEGLGITTALATGRMLADLIRGTPSLVDPAPFDPARTIANGEARCA